MGHKLKLSDIWSSDDDIFENTSKSFHRLSNVDEQSNKNLNDYSCIIYESVKNFQLVKDVLDNYTGIILIQGTFEELSEVVPDILDYYLFTIVCRVKDEVRKSVRVLVLNLTKSLRPYNKIRERYTFCPLCERTTKDYGGKKHHYKSDGTWLRDVWFNYAFDIDILSDSLFLDSIFNLFCKKEDEKILLVEDNTPRIFANPQKTQPVVPDPDYNYTIKESFEKDNHTLINGDSLKVIPLLINQKEQSDVIFVDPPYNLDKEYDVYHDNNSDEDYYDWCEQWATQAYHMLSSEGLFFVLNTPLNNMILYNRIRKHYHLVSEIVWDDLGVPLAGRIQASYYSLLVLSKQDVTLNDKSFFAKNPHYCKRRSCKDKEVSYGYGLDIWSDIHRTRQRRRRWGHPCNLPEELIERIVDVASGVIPSKNLKVLDFFNGVGTTTMACHKKGVSSVGIEISSTYHSISKYRISNNLYYNPDVQVKEKSNLSKKSIQIKVASIVERNPKIKNLAARDQLKWLKERGLLTREEISIFRGPSEIMKGVGKDGVGSE